MNIVETTFGPKKYLTLRKSISTDQISDKQMYDEAGWKLGEYIQKHRDVKVSGPWSVLYFMWDERGQKADIGIAFPVEGISSTDDNSDLELIEILPLKAAKATLDGSYDKLKDVHQELGAYVSEQQYAMVTPVTAIEEYVIDPMSDPNPEHWKTDVYYFHD